MSNRRFIGLLVNICTTAAMFGLWQNSIGAALFACSLLWTVVAIKGDWEL